jgi:hypothetical protein
MNPVYIFFKSLEGVRWDISEEDLDTMTLADTVYAKMKTDKLANRTIAHYSSAIAKFLTFWIEFGCRSGEVVAKVNLQRLCKRFQTNTMGVTKASKLDIERKLAKLKKMMPPEEDFHYVQNSKHFNDHTNMILNIPNMDDSELTPAFLSTITSFLLSRVILGQPLRQEDVREVKLVDYERDLETFIAEHPEKDTDEAFTIHVSAFQKTGGIAGYTKVYK